MTRTPGIVRQSAGQETPMKLLITMALAATFLAAGIPANAATYYVAKSGNDSGSCTSTSTPCLTIGRAVALATSPGDIVQVGAGTYTENVSLSRAGASGKLTTVRGQDGSGCPTTAVSDVNSPTGTRPNSSAILVGGFQVSASYVAIDCFHIKSNNTGNGGVGSNAGLTGNSYTNLEVDGNGCTKCGGGFYVDGVATVTSSGYSSNFTI